MSNTNPGSAGPPLSGCLEKVLVRHTGKLEEAINITPYARQEWRFVLCPPLQAQVRTFNMRKSRMGKA